MPQTNPGRLCTYLKAEETEEPADNDDESESEEEETYELEEYVDECEDEVLEFDIIDD